MADRHDIRVVLFDLGGVLVELGGLQIWMDWNRGRYDEEETWRRWLASPAVRRFETGRSAPAEFARELIDEFDLELDPDHLLREFEAWPRGLLPGARALLVELEPRVTRACFSNSNHLHWPRKLDEFGLRHAFEHLFASHLCGRIKPDVEAFEHVVQALGERPEHVLFLDDNALNVEGARAVGLCAERVRGPSEARAALVARGLLGD